MKTRNLLSALFICASFTISAQIIHVPSNQPTIQAGINVASQGDTILVADGIYYENFNFKGKAITVASNFILDGDTNHIINTVINGSNPVHPDSASVVVFGSGEDTTSILCGFTITGGKGTNMQPEYSYQAGGGIFCYNSGAKIINNYIINDSIITDIQGIGAGIYAGPWGSDAFLVLKNNKINDNYIYTTTTEMFSSAPAVATECHCIIRENEIINNTSISENRRASGAVFCRTFEEPRFNDISGNNISYNKTFSLTNISSKVFAGAIYIMGNYGRISGNVIKYNEVSADSTAGECNGAGITALFTDTSLTIENNIISHNKYITGYQCWGGGIYMMQATARISNNLIYGNLATKGGGIAIVDADPDKTLLINNTIIDNTAMFGGGIWTSIDSTIVINTIVYDNTATMSGPEILDVNNTMTVNYSNIKNGWPGVNNIKLDPQFVDPTNGDFHIPCSSPCWNAGADSVEIDNLWYYCPLYDLDGNPRPDTFYFIPDMGAYEYPDTCINPGINDFNHIKNASIGIHIYPNPFKTKTAIEFNNPHTGFVKLSITDFAGRGIQTVVSKQLPAGTHRFEWNAGGLPAGMYFLRLQTNGLSETRKLLLFK